MSSPDLSQALLRQAWQATRLRRAFQPVDRSSRLDLPAVLGLAMIIAGIVVIHLFSKATPH